MVHRKLKLKNIISPCPESFTLLTGQRLGFSCRSATELAKMKATVDLVYDCHCDLGESPVWDAKSKTLFFIDINSNTILGFKPADSTNFTIQLDEPVGTIVPTTQNNRLLAATRSNVLLIDLDARVPTNTVLATVPPDHGISDDIRFNDGKASPQGALILGRMHLKWRDGNRGRLYALRPSRQQQQQNQQLPYILEQVLDTSHVHLPNGMTWKSSNSSQPQLQLPYTFYFADSGSETITAYDTDSDGIPIPSTATIISNRPTNHTHVPDGLTIDCNGNLWVALGESGSVVCYNSTTGEEVGRVELPVKRPTACTWGGEELDELYVTTRVESGEGRSEHHGGLFRVKVEGVKGVAAAYEFVL